MTIRILLTHLIPKKCWGIRVRGKDDKGENQKTLLEVTDMFTTLTAVMIFQVKAY